MYKKLIRLLKIFYIRIIRSKSSPHNIAFATALGIFVSCFVPPGAHTVTIIVLAIVFRTDKVISYAATWFANPYTMPIMYPVFCYTGSKVVGQGLSFGHIDHELMALFKHFSFYEMEILGKSLALPFFIGGAIFGLIFAFISYFIVYYLIIKYREKRDINKQIRLRYHRSKLKRH